MVVGFIGLGRMGSLMSVNLQRAGFRLRTWDKAKKGNCASARDAATGADVLITMLPDGKAVEHAVMAALPGLRQLLRRRQRVMDRRAVREDRDVVTIA